MSEPLYLPPPFNKYFSNYSSTLPQRHKGTKINNLVTPILYSPQSRRGRKEVYFFKTKNFSSLRSLRLGGEIYIFLVYPGYNVLYYFGKTQQ
jgi:hypothetical protein